MLHLLSVWAKMFLSFHTYILTPLPMTFSSVHPLHIHPRKEIHTIPPPFPSLVCNPCSCCSYSHRCLLQTKPCVCVRVCARVFGDGAGCFLSETGGSKTDCRGRDVDELEGKTELWEKIKYPPQVSPRGSLGLPSLSQIHCVLSSPPSSMHPSPHPRGFCIRISQISQLHLAPT